MSHRFPDRCGTRSHRRCRSLVRDCPGLNTASTTRTQHFGWNDLSARPRHVIHMATVIRRITSIVGFEAGSRTTTVTAEPTIGNGDGLKRVLSIFDLLNEAPSRAFIATKQQASPCRDEGAAGGKDKRTWTRSRRRRICDARRAIEGAWACSKHNLDHSESQP
jgi:hypothetical protein